MVKFVRCVKALNISDFSSIFWWDEEFKRATQILPFYSRTVSSNKKHQNNTKSHNNYKYIYSNLNILKQCLTPFYRKIIFKKGMKKTQPVVCFTLVQAITVSDVQYV